MVADADLLSKIDLRSLSHTSWRFAIAKLASDMKVNRLVIDVAEVDASWLSEARAHFDSINNWRTTTDAAGVAADVAVAVDASDCSIRLVSIEVISVDCKQRR